MRRSAAPFLFIGTLLAAAGYGATFLLPTYFRARGGSELDAGMALGAAMAGTFVGVPLVGWFSARFDAARMAALACCAIAAGFLGLALAPHGVLAAGWLSGGLIGLGWGMFYLGAPMSLSERVAGSDRAFWFTRFGAFQMAGIGGGPLALNLAIDAAGWSAAATFALVAAGCLLAALALWMYGVVAPLTRPASTPHAGPVRTPGSPAMRASRAWVRSIVTLRRSPAIRPILMVACGACVFSGLMTFQAALVAGTAARTASFYAVYAVTVVAARLLLGRVMARWPQQPLAVGLLTLMALGVAAMFGVGLHPAFQLLSAVLTGLGYGLVYSLIQTWAVNHAPPEHQHAALTWFVVSYFMGVFGFPTLGGWLLVQLGREAFLSVLLLAALSELALVLWPQSTSRLRPAAKAAANADAAEPA